MYLIFQVDGGIGKCIAATAVVEAARKKYPSHKIIVVSGYPEVWVNNPHVDKSFVFGQLSYFWRDYIDGQNSAMMLHNPYMEADIIYERKHLIEAWCSLNNLPYNNEQPKVYLTQREVDFYQKAYASDKPILVLQTNGGAQNQQMKYSWARDLPVDTVNKLIAALKGEYNIIIFRRDDQLRYDHTTPITGNFRELCALLKMSSKRILIDSFAQHACAALDLPATVCWIANSPTVFGYKMHDNIKANAFTSQPDLRNAYISKFNISGEPLEFPFNHENEIFDVAKILESVLKESSVEQLQKSQQPPPPDKAKTRQPAPPAQSKKLSRV